MYACGLLTMRGFIILQRVVATMQNFVEGMREDGCLETMDNVAWNDSGIDLEAMKEFWDEKFSTVEA